MTIKQTQPSNHKNKSKATPFLVISLLVAVFKTTSFFSIANFQVHFKISVRVFVHVNAHGAFPAVRHCAGDDGKYKCKIASDAAF